MPKAAIASASFCRRARGRAVLDCRLPLRDALRADRLQVVLALRDPAPLPPRTLLVLARDATADGAPEVGLVRPSVADRELHLVDHELRELTFGEVSVPDHVERHPVVEAQS